MPGFTLIDGPEAYLNRRFQDPFPFAEADQLAAWNLTWWLYVRASDHVANHNGNWSDFSCATGIKSAYPLIWQCDNQKTVQREACLDELTERGVAILNATTEGMPIVEMFDEWMREIAETL